MKKTFAVILLALGTFLAADEEIVRISLQDTIPDGNGEYVLLVHIKEGWHINSAEPPDEYSIPAVLKISGGKDAEISSVKYPDGEMKTTPWGGDLSLYEGELRIPFKLTGGQATRDVELEFVYQACDDLTCLPPKSAYISLNVENSQNEAEAGMGESKPLQPVEKIAASTIGGREAETGPFQNKSMFLVLVLVFAMGLALNLTPCVYPLIPVTMGYFLSQKDARSPALLAVMYVAGLALTYSLIGTLAAFGGSMMGSLLAHPATLIFFSLLMLALSLSMFGLYEFRLPKGLMQAGGGSRTGAAGALIMGLTMGIVAAPCVGPFIVSLLGFVAQKGNVFTGFITFFVLALGLGLPYLFLGIFSARIADLPRSGEWLNGVRIFFGLALVGMAIYFILPLIPGAVSQWILPVYMIIAAVYYAVIDRSGHTLLWFSRLKVILAMAVLAAGILMLRPATVPVQGLSWERYSQERLQEAIDDNEAVIIDFYADWCMPCKELEHITFADPEVMERMRSFILLKVDLTISNPANNALVEKFDVVGVPTILFYDQTGTERADLRLNGFEKPEDFKHRLNKVMER